LEVSFGSPTNSKENLEDIDADNFFVFVLFLELLAKRSKTMENNTAANVVRFDGLSEIYHSSRPSPPPSLRNLISRYLFGKETSNKIDLVVDIG
jgi:hypothetical protein